MRLPGARWSSSSSCIGLMCGNSMMTMATKPINARRMASRKTVPSIVLVEFVKSVDGPLKFDDRVDQLHCAGGQHAMVDNRQVERTAPTSVV